MINLIIVGIGNLTTKIIPAVKKLEERKQVKNVIFVDTKPVEKILEEALKIPNDLYEWFKMQKSHIILQDNGNNSTLINKIKDYVVKDEVRTAVYMATPPSAYHSCVIKYNEIAQVFFLEKPWADDPSKLEQTLKSAGNKRVLGIDHYLWKEYVRRFLKDDNNITKLESGNFDFVISEDLPPKDRKYYWEYGEVAYMMPHVLPLLDKLFNLQATILDSKEFKFRGAIYNPNDLEYVNKNNKSIIKKER
jgi:glucose-6-phosphate 1-dehydrogenase